MSTGGDSVGVETGPTLSPRGNGDAPEPAQSFAPDDPGEPEGLGDAEFEGPEEGETGQEPPTEDADEAGSGDDQAETGDEPVMIDELEVTSDEAGYDAFATPPEMSQMLFVDVVLLLPATHPVVVLQEADAPFRELRIPVGGAEGIAIGYAARQVATPRPLTHELFARVLEEFGMTLDVVRITDVRGSAFSAELVVSGPMGSRVIDCRPSDAIALTLRQRLPAPIMASPIVLAVAGTDPLGAN